MPKKLPTAISEEEFTQLITVTKKKHHRIAFLLAYGAGLRVSEIVGNKTGIPPLTADKFDWQGRSIRIFGKGSKERIVPIPKGFKEEHLKLLPIDITVRSLERAFRNRAKDAGILEKKPDMHFHNLRHGFGSRLASQGVPIHHIRTLMGHSNISTTNVYLELNPKEALKKYEELF